MANNYWERTLKNRIARRRFLQTSALAGVGLGAAALIGCGSDDSGGDTAATSGEETGPLAPSQVLTVRYYDDPGGFDPATLFRIEVENIAFNIYSGLTTYDADGKIIPDLAESWEMSDPTTYTFKLAKNVKWQQGFGDFTAQDVVYSYKRIMDPATASTYRAEFNNVTSVEAPDASTVVIKLKSPDANFLHQVANYHQGQVVNQKAIEKWGADYRFHPVGTGPFNFESFTPSQQIVLTRFNEYFKGPATLEKIDFRIIKDDNTAAIALQNKEVDLAMRISADEPLRRVKESGNFTMNTRAGYALSLTVFNTQNQYLKDARVRQAYLHAVDRKVVVDTTAPLTSTVATNIVPEWMDVFTSDTAKYAYDEAKAKQLLSAAGFAGGFTLDQPTIAVNESTQLTQSFLDKVGIKSDFRIVDTPTYNGIRTRGEFDVSGRLLPAINPDTIFFSYLHPDNIAPKGLNGARYSNAELTKNLEAARAEPDFTKRKALYALVQKKAMEDVPYGPNTGSAVYWPGYKWVTGVKINPLAQVGFYDVKLLAH